MSAAVVRQLDPLLDALQQFGGRGSEAAALACRSRASVSGPATGSAGPAACVLLLASRTSALQAASPDATGTAPASLTRCWPPPPTEPPSWVLPVSDGTAVSCASGSQRCSETRKALPSRSSEAARGDVLAAAEGAAAHAGRPLANSQATCQEVWCDPATT